MNVLKLENIDIIRSKIFEIRGQHVMLDRDLAALYGVETRALNQAVKRNAARFPDDFMFQLSDAEVEHWKSQIVISNAIKMGVRRRPFAFTELGVAMLSSVLKSPTAIQVNIGIMRAFVAVRRMVTEPDPVIFAKLRESVNNLRDYVEDVLTDQNEINEDTSMRLELIEQSLAELRAVDRKHTEKPKIGFRK